MRCPSPCSHYLSAAHKRMVSLNLCRAGACSRRKVVRTIFQLHTLFALTQRLPPGGSWRGATEGDRVTLKSCYPHPCALSPTRFHREPPLGGSLGKCAPPHYLCVSIVRKREDMESSPTGSLDISRFGRIVCFGRIVRFGRIVCFGCAVVSFQILEVFCHYLCHNV